MCNDNKDADLTVLDSQFGKGDSQTEFDKRGLPNRKPSIKKPIIIVVIIFLLSVLCVTDPLGLFVDNAAEEKLKFIAIENNIYLALQKNDWDSSRSQLALILASDLQKINSWLNEVVVITHLIKQREWAKAYEMNLSPVPYLTSLSDHDFNLLIKDKNKEIKSKISSEFQTKEKWVNCDKDDLLALRVLFNDTPDNSTYKIEINESLTLQIQRKRMLLQGQFKKALTFENWEQCELVLKNWSHLIPDDDTKEYQQQFIENKQSYEQNKRCYAYVVSGQVVKAVSEISAHPSKEGRYAESLNNIYKGFLALESQKIKFNLMFEAFNNGLWDNAFDLMSDLQNGGDNAVLAIVKDHWSKLALLDITRRDASQNNVDEIAAVLKVCKQILRLLPENESPYKKNIMEEIVQHTATLQQYLEELKNKYESYWAIEKYPEAYNSLKKIVAIQAENNWANTKLLMISATADKLFSEIYVLYSYDKEMAKKRFEELEFLLPEDHSLVIKARKIISSQ